MIPGNYYQAVLDFRRARRRAARELRRARLSGRSAELLSYDQVRQMVRATGSRYVGLREIPLHAIVGSAGRASEFTRSFLPLQDGAKERWARIQARFNDLEGLPPIEVYQIGEAYFVLDGHHRVSVARQLGVTYIEAYVTEVEAKVPLSPDVQPDELIAKAEYASFLEQSRLHEMRPGVDLGMTTLGQYPKLLEQIEVYREFLSQQQGEITAEKAVARWYDDVYLPVVQVIRDLGLLESFPEQTEADLYLWVSEHRVALEQGLGWDVEPEEAAADLAEQFSPGPQQRIQRAGRRLLDALTPDEWEGGPAPGTWRQERLAIHRSDCMFADILVPVSGEESGWPAVAQAVEIACREDAHLLGLHVVRTAAEKESDKVRAVQAEFARLCDQLGVRGKLAVEVGRVSRKICDRARWADLVVLGLAHPPAAQPATRLSSGLRALIRRCSTPLLAVPEAFSPLARPLLAYDGSPKAREALYVATYVAARGQVPLTVVTVEAEHVAPEALAQAGEYLEAHGVQATLVQEHGPVAEAILKNAEAHQSDLILTGGYGHGPLLEVALGSVVDQVLRASRQPVLICR